MTSYDYERVRALFHELAELGSDEREKVLEERDVPGEVREEIRELLLLSDEHSDAFEERVLDRAGPNLLDESPQI